MPEEPQVNTIQNEAPPNTQAVIQKAAQSPFVRMITIAIILIIILAFSVLILMVNRNKNKHLTLFEDSGSGFVKPTITPESPKSVGLQTNKQWVNCSDVRDVINDGDMLYVGCLGGVLVYNPRSGKITDQISMTQGLPSSIVTSLQKSGDTLYIGTQNGFSIYNTVSHKNKNVTIKEGLINGQNIYLLLDGQNLWVGTFNGLSLYNTQTGTLKNYTSELVDDSTNYSVSKIYATDKAVYFIILANNGSPGGLARFDKKTSEWTKAGPSAFATPTAQLPRVDLTGLASVKDNIYVTGVNGMLWKTIDSPELNLIRLKNAEDQIKKDSQNSNPHLYSNQDDLFVVNDAIDYKLSNEDSLVRVYPSGEIPSNVLKNITYSADQHFVDKLYFRSSDNSKWLNWFDPVNGDSGSYQLADRPSSFLNIAFAVNNTPYLCADGVLWRKKELNTELERFGSLKCAQRDTDTSVFYPLVGTSSILAYTQSCGMLCSEPELHLINFNDGSQLNIPLPFSLTQVLSSEAGAGSFASLTPESYDDKTDMVRFTYNDKDAVQSITYNVKTKQWSSPANYQPPVTVDVMSTFCNKNYIFDTAKNMFLTNDCSLPLKSAGLSYTVQKTTPQPQQYISSTILVTSADGKSSSITVPLHPEAVLNTSPDEPKNSVINNMTLVSNNLFVSSEAGMGVYDLKTKTWQTYGLSDGLVSSNVREFVVGNSMMYILTNEGGFSMVSLH